MNKLETGKLMAVLASVYRDFYKDRDPAAMLDIWQGALAEVPYAAANAAAMAYIRTEHFSPVPADIYDRAMRLTGGDGLSEADAWALVAKAVRSTDWLAPEKQFNALPEQVRRAVGTAHTLVEWGKTDEESFSTVIASNFRRVYRAQASVERQLRAVPAEVRAALSGVGKALPE